MVLQDTKIENKKKAVFMQPSLLSIAKKIPVDEKITIGCLLFDRKKFPTIWQFNSGFEYITEYAQSGNGHFLAYIPS